jgi:hypothetical protein
LQRVLVAVEVLVVVVEELVRVVVVVMVMVVVGEALEMAVLVVKEAKDQQQWGECCTDTGKGFCCQGKSRLEAPDAAGPFSPQAANQQHCSGVD